MSTGVEAKLESKRNLRMSIMGNGLVGFFTGSAVFDGLLHQLPGGQDEFYPLISWVKLGLAGFFILARGSNWTERVRGLFLGFTLALASELINDGYNIMALGAVAIGVLEGIRVIRDVKLMEANTVH